MTRKQGPEHEDNIIEEPFVLGQSFTPGPDDPHGISISTGGGQPEVVEVNGEKYYPEEQSPKYSFCPMCGLDLGTNHFCYRCGWNSKHPDSVELAAAPVGGELEIIIDDLMGWRDDQTYASPHYTIKRLKSLVLRERREAQIGELERLEDWASHLGYVGKGRLVTRRTIMWRVRDQINKLKSEGSPE